MFGWVNDADIVDSPNFLLTVSSSIVNAEIGVDSPFLWIPPKQVSVVTVSKAGIVWAASELLKLYVLPSQYLVTVTAPSQ